MNMKKRIYQNRWFCRKVLRKLTGKQVLLKKYGNKQVLDNQSANGLIKEMIESGKPFMVARLGSVELNTIVRNEKKCCKDEKARTAFHQLNINAGFFPEDEKLLGEYCATMFDACEEIDLLGVWSNEMEDYVVDQYCKQAKLCRLKDLEPWNSSNPWSAALEEKRVLVIHPFENTIKSQYSQKRKEIFQDDQILPKFKELYTVKAVQTIAGEKDPRFSDWFEALQWMYEEAMQYDFDVAIIGCGAYGLPLAAMLKKSGKQAVHLGGATQLLFGIKGKRWDEMSAVNRWYNDAWTRPQAEEQPQNRNMVEAGCYW